MMTITDQQLHLLHHTLGVTPKRREPYRNHFVAGEGHRDMRDLEALEAAGWMVRGRTPKFCDAGDIVFQASEAGRAYALDNLPMPPKLTKYGEYVDADYGHSFADWLGIELPRVHTDYHGNYQYWRFKPSEGVSIRGEWKPTKKEAKASYKAALKRHNDQMRAWRNPERIQFQRESASTTFHSAVVVASCDAPSVESRI